MEFSIIIPTFNNYNYCKLSLDSIKKNSTFNHEILVHINGDDPKTEDYLKSIDINYTKSDINLGLCSGVNIAATKSQNNLLVYAHDDMYFCPKWDFYLIEEIKNISSDKFYFSSTQISNISRYL